MTLPVDYLPEARADIDIYKRVGSQRDSEMAEPLPDDALVVRGGQNLPENFAQGSGVQISADGKLHGVSVNSAPGLSAAELSAPNPRTGYPGIRNNQIGVTTAGAIRAAGGDVTASPTRGNPHHATLNGLDPQKASDLFRPTTPNPHRQRRE